MTDSEKEPIVIKKYANRRLYNTATSSYVTLDHLSQMVKSGNDFVVYDAKSNDDITRSVLTQIIFEEEAKGQNLLPIKFLRQLIRYYGDSLQVVVPDYLDMSMQSFTDNQEQMREALPQNLTGSSVYKQFEELGRQNMTMFSQAMQMFSPTAFSNPSKQTATPASTAANSGDSSESQQMMTELKEQMAQMQQKLDAMSKK